MRSKEECEDFDATIEKLIEDETKRALSSLAYEACIPKDFWHVVDEDITHNREVFEKIILPYAEKMKLARKRGYGLLLLGDNGAGKTIFTSFVLMKALSKGFTAYYTTLPQLDHDVKRGFNDPEVARRLEWMLTSDFLALDEVGKERYKSGDTHSRLQVERILKSRFDNSLCTLLATNADLETLKELYGDTIISIIVGKYQTVTLEPGDYREKLRERMNKEMGYE
jgi:DNA replication protein DnaC